MDQLVSLETAKIAKEVGYKEKVTYLYLHGEDNLIPIAVLFTTPPYRVSINDLETEHGGLPEDCVPAPTQTSLSKWLREKCNLHVYVGRNASGYYWEICNATFGTGLKDSDLKGTNSGGAWDVFEEAMGNALRNACLMVGNKDE